MKPNSKLLIEIDKGCGDYSCGEVCRIKKNKVWFGKITLCPKCRKYKQGILAQMKDELEFLENEIDGINSILTEEAVNKRISDLKHDINLNGVGK